VWFFAYFKHFIPRFSVIISPIRDLLRKKVAFQWGEKQDAALAELKELLLSTVVLVFPNMNESYCPSIMVDSSSKALAHCLMQKKMVF
jgi:hypothetical protein